MKSHADNIHFEVIERVCNRLFMEGEKVGLSNEIISSLRAHWIRGVKKFQAQNNTHHSPMRSKNNIFFPGMERNSHNENDGDIFERQGRAVRPMTRMNLNMVDRMQGERVRPGRPTFENSIFENPIFKNPIFENSIFENSNITGKVIPEMNHPMHMGRLQGVSEIIDKRKHDIPEFKGDFVRNDFIKNSMGEFVGGEYRNNELPDYKGDRIPDYTEEEPVNFRVKTEFNRSPNIKSADLNKDSYGEPLRRPVSSIHENGVSDDFEISDYSDNNTDTMNSQDEEDLISSMEQRNDSYIMCFYVKVTKLKKKWKFVLKNGFLNDGHEEVPFATGTAELELEW